MRSVKVVLYAYFPIGQERCRGNYIVPVIQYQEWLRYSAIAVEDVASAAAWGR
jgi:hypothetical protein